MIVRDLLFIKGIDTFNINGQDCTKYHASQEFGTHEVVSAEVVTSYSSLFKEDIRITINEEDLADPDKLVTPEVSLPETAQFVQVNLNIICTQNKK